MSFFRHEKIYHFDVRPNWQGDSTATLPAHRYDEFSAGYSLAGCAPAEPPSASPANCSFLQLVLVGNTLPANSNLSLFTVSQGEGAVQGLVWAPSRQIPIAWLASMDQLQRTFVIS